MAIRSVDLMILYSKMSDVEKAQQMEQQQGRINNENITTNEIKRKEVEGTQVQETPDEAESAAIKEEQERKQKQNSRGQSQDEEDMDGENRKKFSISPHTGSIDITI